MVASDECDALWVSHLESEEQEECLNGVVAAINKVAHKEVIGVGALPSHLEQLHQVVKLTVDVTANLKTIQPIELRQIEL